MRNFEAFKPFTAKREVLPAGQVSAAALSPAVATPTVAATHFNWLVMGEATNRVMMMGNGAIPGRQALKRCAAQAVTAFLAAYGTDRT